MGRQLVGGPGGRDRDPQQDQRDEGGDDPEGGVATVQVEGELNLK